MTVETTISITLPTPVFDIHQHVGALVVHTGEQGQAVGREADQARRRDMMSRFGITQAALAPSLQYERPNGWRDTTVLNDAVAAYRDSCPESFPRAFGTVDLLSGAANCETEMRRIADDLSMSGVMWHHRYQGMFLDDRRMHPLLDLAEELGLIVAVHLFADSAMEAPDALERLALAHPQPTILTLDAFTAFAQVKALVPILERCPNLVLDTAGVFPLGRLVDTVVKAIGSDRLVLGSDMYASPKMWNYPAGVLEVATSEDLDEHQKTQILYSNAAALLSLSPQPDSDGTRT